MPTRGPRIVVVLTQAGAVHVPMDPNYACHGLCVTCGLGLVFCTLAAIMPATSAASTSTDPLAKPPARTADLDETWAFLSYGVDHIMTRLETGLSFNNYTNLYTAVYNYCTSTKMQSVKTDGNRGKCRL
jgi:hypothetical protein